MNLNWHNILTVYLKELKDSLRDRRTLISVIVIPTFVMPALFFGVGKIATTVVDKARGETPVIMVLGGADSPGVVGELKASKKLRITAATDDWKQQISDKKIRAAVEIPAGFEAGLKAGSAGAVTIYNYEGRAEVRLRRGRAGEILPRPARPHGDGAAAGAFAARDAGETVRFQASERGAAREGRRQPARWHCAVHHHHSLFHRRDVSGDGPDGRGKGTRHDGNAPVQSRGAREPGAGQVPHGPHRLAGGDGPFPDLDGCQRGGGRHDFRRRRGAGRRWRRPHRRKRRPRRASFPRSTRSASSACSEWCCRWRCFSPR
ncbi:MAG: hypothetical protein WDM96_14475 [Lacunisphaera sp.]